MINGETVLIAHLGYPTTTFKAPMIYNPYFEKIGVNAVVMPMGVKAEAYADVISALFRLTNIRGALITMPHKVATLALVDELSVTARIAGACNAVLLRPDGTLLGDMFDGEGFVRGMLRKGRKAKGARGWVGDCGVACRCGRFRPWPVRRECGGSGFARRAAASSLSRAAARDRLQGRDRL